MDNNALREEIERLVALGRMDLDAGYPEYARGYFEKVLALDATNGEAIDGLARVNEVLSHKATAAVEPVEHEPGEPKGYFRKYLIPALIGAVATIIAALITVRSGRVGTEPYLLDVLSLHLSVSPVDPSFIYEGQRMNWGTAVSPQAAVMQEPDYHMFMEAMDTWQRPGDPNVWENLLSSLPKEVIISETSTPEIHLILSYDAPAESPTIVLEGLALQLLQVDRLSDPYVIKYAVGGATGRWTGGRAEYGSKPGLYPVEWYDIEAIDGTKSLPRKYLTLTPGEVEGLTITIGPKAGSRSGLYLMRFIAKVRYEGKIVYVHSDKVFRCAVLQQNHWDAPGVFGPSGWKDFDMLVEWLRMKAYLESRHYFQRLVESNPNNPLYKRELALVLLNWNAADEDTRDQATIYLKEYLASSETEPEYDWVKLLVE